MTAVAIADGQIRMHWTNEKAQAASVVIFMVALSVITGVITQWSNTIYRSVRYPSRSAKWACRLALTLTYCTSFLFVFTSGLLQFGLGLASARACNTAGTLCVTVYALSKAFMYAFLLERVYIVSCCEKRRKSRAWLAGATLYLAGLPIIVVFIVTRRYRLQPNGECHLSIPMFMFSLVAWDVILGIYLSAAFAYPLSQTPKQSPLRDLAVKSLLATLVALCTSATNLAVVIALRGQLGWLCLSLCTIDILINTICLSAVISPTEEESNLPHPVVGSEQETKLTCDLKPVDGLMVLPSTIVRNSFAGTYHTERELDTDTTRPMDLARRFPVRPKMYSRDATSSATLASAKDLPDLPFLSFERGRPGIREQLSYSSSFYSPK